MRFYGYFRSSSAYRCRIAFNLKGIEPEFVSVHLRRDGGQHKKPEFADLNPQKLVPALETDQGVLSQSLAIIEWLDETQGGAKLLPDDPFQRAEVRSFALHISADIHPLANLRVLQYLKGELGQSDEAVERWCQAWIGQGLAGCEEIARRHKNGAFCFGDKPGLADVCLMPQLHSARRFNCALDAFPRLLEIEKTCAALPAFEKARPEIQPDAE